jgi:hypothetical protein
MRGRMCLAASIVGIALFSFSPGALSLGSSNPAALQATDKQDLNLLSREAVPTSTRIALRRWRRPGVRQPVYRHGIGPRIVYHPRGWRGARWGAVVAGVTLGTVIAVAANTPPPRPAPELCWTWTNKARTHGYWYYCTGR